MENYFPTSPLPEGTHYNFWMKLTQQKLEAWATVW